MESIYEKVVAVVANQFEKSPESLTPQTTFREDLCADSISVVELIMAFEDEFGQSISDEDAAKMLNIQDVVDYINTLDK